MANAGAWMDPDLNKYDLNHRVTHHPKMSDEEWEDVYRQAWDAFYSPEHVRTVIRRTVVQEGKSNPRKKMRVMLWFYLMYRIERLHPLEGGIFRLKNRTDRRAGLPIEPRVVFYPRYALETARKLVQYGWMIFQAYRSYWQVMGETDRASYSDTAIAPVDADDLDDLELFHSTQGGEQAVEKSRDHARRRKRYASAAAGR